MLARGLQWRGCARVTSVYPDRCAHIKMRTGRAALLANLRPLLRRGTPGSRAPVLPNCVPTESAPMTHSLQSVGHGTVRCGALPPMTRLHVPSRCCQHDRAITEIRTKSVKHQGAHRGGHCSAVVLCRAAARLRNSTGNAGANHDSLRSVHSLPQEIGGRCDGSGSE